MTEFDDDIELDLRENNILALAFVAQDLRNIVKHVAPRSLVAAVKRKRKEEETSDEDHP